MDYHENALFKLCRIRVLRTLSHHENKLKKKAMKGCSYVHLIRLLFTVDIADDNEDVHPLVLCTACYYILFILMQYWIHSQVHVGYKYLS